MISNPQNPVRILGQGIAYPPEHFTQAEVATRFGYTNRIARQVFGAPHIVKRHLMLPPVTDPSGRMPVESNVELIERFHRGAKEIGIQAIYNALAAAGIGRQDIGALITLTSTGFMVPGLSCLFVREMGLKVNTHRLDVVGMGCNAGVNGLTSTFGWAHAHPGKYAVMVCCEINSAAYCPDDTARDAIVNSLFGDGAGALVLGTGPAEKGPAILDFECHMIPEQWDSMRFDYHPERDRWRFFLSKDIPYILGVHSNTPIDSLLERNGVRRRDIEHWVIHTGGGAVIDAIKLKLGLTEHDIRHTRSVLRDFGNLSSGSFVFSYSRLVPEVTPGTGDHGIMMTMGPGAQIETALLRWS